MSASSPSSSNWNRRSLPVAPSELMPPTGNTEVRQLLEQHLKSVGALLRHPSLAAPSAAAAMVGAKRQRTEAGSAGDWASADLRSLRDDLRAFAAARDWDQFHTPRNLALALTGEVGELCECFQWKGDAGCEVGLPGWPEAKRTHLGEELSDCLLYLVRLSDKCGIDLPAAASAKLARNAAKYPAELVRGSAKKYTDYAPEESPGGLSGSSAAAAKPPGA